MYTTFITTLFETKKFTFSKIRKVMNMALWRYIKPHIYIIFILCNTASAISQIKAPTSYALVIGISKYEDPNINSLNFAHLDAQAYAQFCSSPDGLNIPEDQMRLLTNETATYWNITDGLYWLKTKAQKGDLVYIYFAGHGDMESKELKYGYLLTYDSRFMNYLGRSLSLDILNKTAHTLSVDRKAKVFLITDACHSGKLAGVDFNGTNLVTLNLMQIVSNNEIRITSCNEGELSYEDETWGYGRGAFSYFLTKGMAGAADGIKGKKDGNINIAEIKAFLSEKVPDGVRTVKRAKQNPVIMGNDTTILNPYKINSSNVSMTSEQQLTYSNRSNNGSRSVGVAPDQLSEDINKAVISKISDPTTDFRYLSNLTSKKIVQVLLDGLKNEDKYTSKTLSSPVSYQLVAKALFGKVQQIIDLYLIGDDAELEKRRYYAQVDKPYDQYPYMLEIAIKLLPKDHYLIPSLEMQKEYLIGLTYRLKASFVADYQGLIDTALLHQSKALSFSSEAAYIHNELGILYLINKDRANAKYHFERATIIAPLWPLPVSNLANFYFSIDDYVSAKKYVDSSLDMKSNLQNPYIIDGNLYMKDDNMLFAEEQYQKAIKLNTRHFIPFKKLGDLYLKIQDYHSSNDYYRQAELRKKGLTGSNLLVNDFDIDGVVNVDIKEINIPIDSINIGQQDMVAHFAVGKLFFDKNDYKNAQRWFEKVIALDVNNPLVYYYLGQTAYYFESYARAEYYFKLANNNHLDDSLFNKHILLLSQKPQSPAYALSTYQNSNFNKYLSTLYLGRTYEKWGNFVSASEHYNTCIKLSPENKLTYSLLWNMYKTRKDLELAENTINRFGKYFPEEWDNASADFYKWVLDNFREDLEITERYAYKYGLLMHQYVMDRPEDTFGELLSPIDDKNDRDFETEISELKHAVFFDNNSEKLTYMNYTSPNNIEKPLSTGVRMFKKVVSISVDKNIRADAFAKMGDLYFRAESMVKALENYEECLVLKNDDIGIRSKAIWCADELYFFKKSFSHLKFLKENNALNFDDAILLADYYMRYGARDSAITLLNEIALVHPSLKEDIEEALIITLLRFEKFDSAIESINEYILNNEEDDLYEYMLARAYAGLNKPNDALIHLIKADKLGFKLGFVYKNDTIFDPYRDYLEWHDINTKMDEYAIKAAQ
jgi:Flp pilus assembly protein TadD